MRSKYFNFLKRNWTDLFGTTLIIVGILADISNIFLKIQITTLSSTLIIAGGSIVAAPRLKVK